MFSYNYIGEITLSNTFMIGMDPRNFFQMGTNKMETIIPLKIFFKIYFDVLMK